MLSRVLLEAYAGAAFQQYSDLPDLDFGEGASPCHQAAALAGRLRAHGLPVQAYRLPDADHTGLPFPFLAYQEGWHIVSARESETALPPREVRPGAVIVAEPPVGTIFRLQETGGADPPFPDVPDVLLCYMAPDDDPDLASRQLFPELDRVLDQVAALGRDLLYVDALGLVPVATVRASDSLVSEASRFEQVLAELLRETTGIGRGVAPVDTHSPIWGSVGRFLAARKVKSTVESLPYLLWQEIVTHDAAGLNQLAVRLLVVGRLKDAAQRMREHSLGFWRLNVARRDAEFSSQVGALHRGASPPPVIFSCREIDHYGGPEALLARQGIVVDSLILGDERIPDLLGVPQVRWGLAPALGISVSDDQADLFALHDCVKAIIRQCIEIPQGQTRWAARMLGGIDRLTWDDVEGIVTDLDSPSRIFLRQKSLQDVSEQLLYLVRERGAVPLDLDIARLEKGGLT